MIELFNKLGWKVKDLKDREGYLTELVSRELGRDLAGTLALITGTGNAKNEAPITMDTSIRLKMKSGLDYTLQVRHINILPKTQEEISAFSEYYQSQKAKELAEIEKKYSKMSKYLDEARDYLEETKSDTFTFNGLTAWGVIKRVRQADDKAAAELLVDALRTAA